MELKTALILTALWVLGWLTFFYTKRQRPERERDSKSLIAGMESPPGHSPHDGQANGLLQGVDRENQEEGQAITNGQKAIIKPKPNRNYEDEIGGIN